MTLNHFQEEYRQAVNEELPEFHMDMKKMQDELHHRRMLAQHKRRLVAKGCTAAVVFFLLGTGTVAAKNYMSAVIEMRENGYVISGSDSGAELTADCGGQDEVGDHMAARSMPQDNGAAYDEDVFDAGEAGIDLLEADCVEEIEIQEWEYESLSDFLENSPLAYRIPDLALLAAECKGEHVLAMEDDMTIFLHVTESDRSFCLRQSDYRNVESFSTATSYGGENANERKLTNAQGLSYVVFDTVDENGRIEATHAVIVAEGRELSMDFYGFEPEAIEKMLKELNLDLYFR